MEAFSTEEIDKEKFVSQIRKRVKHRLFRSATGHKMDGYLVCSENVTLSDAPIPKFYYYLIVDVDYRIGLLGDDFISKCYFTHDVDGQIEVESFD